MNAWEMAGAAGHEAMGHKGPGGVSYGTHWNAAGHEGMRHGHMGHGVQGHGAQAARHGVRGHEAWDTGV